MVGVYGGRHLAFYPCTRPKTTSSRGVQTGHHQESVSTFDAQNWDQKTTSLRVPAVALTASGGVLLTSSVVTGAIVLSVGKDIEPHCKERGCPKEYWDENDRRIHLAITTDVLLGVGIAAAASGVLLLIIDKIRQSKNENLSFSFIGTSMQGSF
jgi:hypothetical protein